MISLIALLVVVVILVAIGLIKTVAKGRGPVLKVNFRKLGTLRGKTLADVMHGCGAPGKTEIAKDKAGNQVKICTWSMETYSITLVFDHNDVCLGVSSEQEG